MNQGATADVRRRQIDTLKIFNANVAEINENEYHIGFLSGGRQLNLTVQLTPNFPIEKPVISVNPSVNHQWVLGASGEIQNAPGLVNFTVHSDLGRVVQAIIREFEKYPPALWNDQHLQASAAATTQAAVPMATKTQRDPNLPDLYSLSLDELTKLDNDSEFMNDFVEEVTAIRSLNEELDLLMTDVEIIAKDNIEQHNHIIKLKERLNTDNDKFKALGDKYESLNLQYQKKAEEFEPQHIKELLQIATSTADSECESYVDDFLAGKMDVQKFLTLYMDTKKLSAIRKAKEERLSDQLQALERAAH